MACGWLHSSVAVVGGPMTEIEYRVSDYGYQRHMAGTWLSVAIDV